MDLLKVTQPADGGGLQLPAPPRPAAWPGAGYILLWLYSCHKQEKMTTEARRVGTLGDASKGTAIGRGRVGAS